MGGNVLADEVRTITVEFRDGHRVEVPFVYVSLPIDAGFFSYDVPADRREEARGPVAVVARDAADTLVHREAIRWSKPREIPWFPGQPRKPPALPTEPPVRPKPPLQRAAGDGVSVIAGRNGVAVFDTRQVRPELASLLRKGQVGWGCFKIRTREGVTGARGLSVAGKFAPRVGLSLPGVGTPFDGCELQGSYGHIWPDRLDSHSAAEVAFTEAGRRYFEDRAAARDLALLVRSRKAQQIRKRAGELAAALRVAYADAIVRLPSHTAKPPEGTIGYWIGDAGATFVRMSSTGRRFQVVTRDGQIRSENVRPLAFVF